MKKYYIQSRVSTWIEIIAKYTHNEAEKDVRKRFKSEFNFEWLYFEQWDFSVAEWALGDAWLLKAEILADNIPNAINLYFKKLSIILSKVFFCVPVWHSFGFHESLLVSYDEFQTGFYFMRKENEWTWLVITDEVLQILENKNFYNIPDKFFIYYSEFINANTALSWLSLWMSALETIRPESNEVRKKLFGEDLYFKIYGTKPEWIRHKIHHGKYPEEWDNPENDFEQMHEAIRLCLLDKNPDIHKVYDLRSSFVAIPRQKKVIEWHNWIYLLSNNDKPLNLPEIIAYDDIDFFEFQKVIKENLFIFTDTSKKSSDY